MRKKLFFVAAVCFSSHAFAQEDTSAKSLDEVIVTANRLQQKQSQTGKVVTVISRDVLDRSNGRTVAQVLNEQAGITINGALNNAGTVQTTFMRGASSGRTLVLLDGMPLSDPSQINNEFDLNLLLINDVERIEIARGAQSTLYGSDAVAGVINIITRKQNSKKPFNLNSTLSAGNKGTYRGSVQLYGNVEKLAYQICYAELGTKGFSTARDTVGNKNFDRDAYWGNTSSASLTYQATEQLFFRSFLQYNRYKTSIDASAFRDDTDFTQRSNNLNTGFGFGYRSKTVSLSGNYMYSESTRKFLNDSGNVSGFAKFIRDNYFGRNQFVELFATINLAKGFTLLQGADYRFNSFNNKYFSVSSFGVFQSTFKDTSISQQSMYASLIYNGLDEKLNIEAGGRLNVNSKYGSNYTYTFNPSYALNKSLRLFGSIATGFKAPSLYQLYSFAGNKNLKPEESINYEIGLQHSSKAVKHRATFFYREVKTGIDFNNVSFIYYNIPNQIARGLEYEFVIAPVNNLNITGNYTYLAGTEFIQSRITTKDTAYQYLLRRPKHNFNLTVGYHFGNGFYASLNTKTVSNRFDTGGYLTADAKLKGYFLLGAYAEYKYKNYLRFFADAQNITNQVFFDLRGYNSIPFLIQTGVSLSL